MTNLSLNLAKKIDADRHLRLEKVQDEYPEVFTTVGGAGGPSEEHLLDLAPFLLDKPQKFCHEATYETALDYLTDYYSPAQHDRYLVGHFTYIADSLRRGTLNTEYYSREIERKVTQIDHLERETKVQGYWRAWYLNLVEDCLKHVCSPLVWAVSQAKGNKARLEDLRYMSERISILNTVPQFRIIGKDFDPTVRNACAHGGVTLLRDERLLFDDHRGNQVRWTDIEFQHHIQGMLDVCNALSLATKVFIFRNWSQLSGIFQYQALPEDERERPFLSVASTPIIEMRSAKLESLPHGNQITIQAIDKAVVYEELMFDVLAVLENIYRFYPDADWVFLGLEGPRHLSSWVRVPMAALHDWVSGAKSIEQFMQMPDVDLMVFPFKKLPFARKVAAFRRGLAHGLPQLVVHFRKSMEASYATRPTWRIFDVQNKSTGLAKRLQATVIVPKGLTRQQVEPMLIEATDYVRQKLYRTKEVSGYKRKYRKAMANRPAGYIWLEVFTKEKRPQDMWPDKTASYYVCRTEWFDEKLKEVSLQPVLNLPDRVDQSDIAVEWRS